MYKALITDRERDTLDMNINKVDRHGCWPFQGSKNGFGRGQIWLKKLGKRVAANRVIFSLANPKVIVNDDHVVAHDCMNNGAPADNTSCCNPDHLKIMTIADHVRDSFAKGQLPVGSACPQSKLSEHIVYSLRKKYVAGEIKNITAVARILDVHPTSLSKALRGINYKHVSMPAAGLIAEEGRNGGKVETTNLK